MTLSMVGRPALGLAALMLSTLALGPVRAEEPFRPAPGYERINLDLDTEDGHFSEYKITETCGMNALRAVITIKRVGSKGGAIIPLGADSKAGVESNATLGLKGEKDLVALQAVADTKQKRIRIRLSSNVNGAAREEWFAKTYDLKQPIQLALKWGEDGAVEAALEGGETHIIHLGGGVRQVSLANSTGEALFDPVQLGRAGGSVRECSR